MKIIEIKKIELLDFLETDLYKKSKNIPITYQRAISQVKNPRAEDNDVLLIVAVNKTNNIIGYIGALPDKIANFPDIKIAWNTCWWTDKSASSKVALTLLFDFFKAYKNNVMMRDLTALTNTIIKSLKKFTVIKELNAKKFFFRLNLSTKLPKYKLLLKPVDTIINFILYNNFRIFFRKRTKNIQTIYTNEFLDSDEEFISNNNSNEAFKRNVKELNWIIKNPWIRAGETKNSFENRYYFSSIKKSFSNKVLRIKNTSNTIISIIFLTEINDNLEIPYIYYKKEDIEIIGQAIVNHIIENKIVSFLTFNKDLIDWFNSKKTSFYYSKTFKKEFIVNNSISRYFNNKLTFQDGEGDFVFA